MWRSQSWAILLLGYVSLASAAEPAVAERGKTSARGVKKLCRKTLTTGGT